LCGLARTFEVQIKTLASMRFSLFCFSILISTSLVAQTRSKLTFDVSLNPTATYSINTSSSDKQLSSNNPQTYSEYSDSISNFESYKLSMGGTVWVNYLLSRTWTVQAGIGYSEVGFTLKQEDIKFHDKLLTGTGSSGRLEDVSNSIKNVDYSFKYQYLTVPVLFNRYIKRSGDFKWTYYFTMGAAVNILLKHQVKAKLDNFYIEGQNVFKIDSTGYEGRRVTPNIFIGGRFEYKLDKQFSAFAQPMITVFPLSVSKTEMKARPIGLQLNIGVAYNFDSEKDEKHK
jgi:hypothetical protein